MPIADSSVPSTEKEYVLFCDESDRRGKFYSNFYGGVRVPASTMTLVNDALRKAASELALTTEIKWEKVGPGLVERYEKFISVFFDQIRMRRVFMRVMFTHNVHVPLLTVEQREVSYYLLYYQFLKHGFGLADLPIHASPPRIRIYLDEIGDTKEQMANFKGYVKGVADYKAVRAAGGIILDESDITEVRSHDHIIMQALDVVLGSITFRLNDKHKDKPPGQRVRGKRTIAKERLYRFILDQIKRATGKPSFNIGISTGIYGVENGPWSAPYVHWCFVPRNHEMDHSAVKPRKNNAPLGPT